MEAKDILKQIALDVFGTQELREKIADTYRVFDFWQDKHRRSGNELEAKFLELADQIFALIKEAGYKSPAEIMEMFKGYEDTIKLLREQLAHARDGYMKLADLTREQRYDIWKQVETNGK